MTRDSIGAKRNNLKDIVLKVFVEYQKMFHLNFIVLKVLLCNMKKLSILFILASGIFLMAFCMESNSKPMNENKISLHEYTVEDINGDSYDFSKLKGKKVMVVNTASKCGLTPQYEALEALYKAYGSSDFTIVAFPSMVMCGLYSLGTFCHHPL